MAYTKHNWSVGDIITADDLDRIETTLENLDNNKAEQTSVSLLEQATRLLGQEALDAKVEGKEVQ